MTSVEPASRAWTPSEGRAFGGRDDLFDHRRAGAGAEPDERARDQGTTRRANAPADDDRAFEPDARGHVDHDGLVPAGADHLGEAVVTGEPRRVLEQPPRGARIPPRQIAERLDPDAGGPRFIVQGTRDEPVLAELGQLAAAPWATRRPRPRARGAVVS